MKCMKVYFFNDGAEGIVVAKSLKHAVKKLAKYYPRYTVNDIFKEVKKDNNLFNFDAEWRVTTIASFPKAGAYKKSKTIGFI